MPAITLGVAEVEVRLRALRWRLNLFALLQTGFVGLSSLVLATAVIVAFGLNQWFTSVRTMIAVSVAAVIAVAVLCVFDVRRRWLDMVATARLADRRGDLTERLTTLLDLRQRPRPARLAPVLVAQAFALGRRWEPHRIAPRRVPRAYLLTLASLVVLAASPLVAPESPPPTTAQAKPSMAATHTTAVSPADETQLDPSSQLRAVAERRAMTADELAAAAEGEGSDVTGADAVPSDDREPPLQSTMLSQHLLALLPDKMRHAMGGGFTAQKQVDPARQLGADAANKRAPGSGHDQPAPGNGDDNGRQSAEGRRQPQSGDRQTDMPERSGGGENPSAMANRDEPNGDRHDASSPNTQVSDTAPPAGTGSQPSTVMDPRGAIAMGGTDVPKTFKLTITSFLQAAEQRGNQPRTGKRAVGGAMAVSSEPAALSERQQHDDALRKAEIPPEYEDIVRRVYSTRAAP